MVRAELVVARLAELGDRVQRVRLRCPATLEGLAADRDAMELVSFNLMLAVQAASDIAAHLISDEGWHPASTVSGSFTRLRDEGVLRATTAASLSRAVGLRNMVAHGYGGIDPAMVFAAATRGLGDLEAFATEVAAWLARPRA